MQPILTSLIIEEGNYGRMEELKDNGFILIFITQGSFFHWTTFILSSRSAGSDTKISLEI